MGKYANLHAHGVYSILDGHGKYNRYVKQGVKLGMDSMLISEHGNIHGWPDFYDACTKREGPEWEGVPVVKPLLAIEAYQARKTRFDKDEEERSGRSADDRSKYGPHHLILLARNLDGYKNIIKLSSRSFLEGYYQKPRIDHELLAEHSEGVTILSGCLSGEVQQALLRNDFDFALTAAQRFQDIVGKEHFFIEVHDHNIPEEDFVRPQLLEIAKRINALVVPTGDSHYVMKEDAHHHDVMLCVSTNATMQQEGRFQFNGEGYHLQSYDEMAAKFPDEWLSNTLVVADQVDLELNFGNLYFPEFPLPPGETVDSYLDRHVWEGLKRRYGDPLSDDVVSRAQYELRVVKKMGFQSYFLVVSDLVNWAKTNGIRVGWGRGSAAGSILSYALGITNLDPLRFGLLFERFLVEGRKSMPDIDLDFDDRYRDRVINYARDKYGNDRVAHICTFNTVGAKQAIRDAARVLGYDYITGDKLAKMIPKPVLGVSKTLQESLATKDLAEAYEASEESRKIIDAAKGLEGLIRQTGIHAAGVVIAQSDITDFVPVMRKGEDAPIVTQWDMNRVDQNGLLKIDFLGLRNLGVIDRAVINLVEKLSDELDVDTIPLDDHLTYEQLRAGYSVGTFQMESPGMREMMVGIQPTCIEDIMALISLYRPGPMGSGMDKLYIARKNGRTKLGYDHPKLKDVLESTYGIMLYQEDVLNVARHLAGFSAGEADDLRKAIGKKQMDKIGKFREEFVRGCNRHSEVSSEVANKIYSDIEYFGGYGFGRAHAASYAMVSYVTAYLKFNYPVEYMAALLSSVADKKDKAAFYLNECRRMEISVSPPSINHSLADFRVVNEKSILFGLANINGVGESIINSILSARTTVYKSLPDFMRRCNTEILNKATLEHLVRSGSFDELVPEQQRVLSRDEKMNLLDIEKKELSLYVSDHPLLGVWHLLQPYISATIADLETVVAGEHVELAGILTQVTRLNTKRGDTMYRLMLEDLTGEVEVLIFPKEAHKWHGLISEGDIVVLAGKLNKEGDDEHPLSKVFMLNIEKPELPQFGGGEPIIVRCSDSPTHSIIKRMTALINQNPGDSPVYLEFPEGKHVVSMQFPAATSIRMKNDLQLLGIATHESFG